MRTITYSKALNEALDEEMAKDTSVILLGEDIAEHGGSFGVTQGLWKKYGPERVRNTPISEIAIVGAAIGCSLVGLKPVVEIMFNDFIFVAADQIVNQMAKLRYMSGGQFKLPITVRLAMGAGLSQAAQHAQCVYGMFMNVPGLKIVCPSNAYDAKGILKSAIQEDCPVLVFEHLSLYNVKGEIPDEDYRVPLGKASIKREGKDITIIAVSEMVTKSLNVAKKMENQGISIEVIDPISLVPLDMKTIINSVRKTRKVIVAHNGSRTNGAGAEIVARICEDAFPFLDKPIYRISEKDCPIPFSPILESVVLPQEQDLIDAIHKLIK